MRNRESKTALMAASIRAGHFAFWDSPKIFEDPFASGLAGPVWGMIGKSRLVHWISTRLLFRKFSPIWCQILCRARYAEECLNRALEKGIDQYVLIGAGLDSFGLRRKDLREKIKIYELDHPESQDWKRKRLRKLKLEVPKNVEYVPVDFEKKSVGDALRESEIFFDYAMPRTRMDPEDLVFADKLQRYVTRRGEPFLSEFDPDILTQELLSLGFELVENLSKTEIERMYIAQRTDYKRIAPTYFAHLRLDR